ncbi:MAG TPA: ACP S-malonyltransferase [bacterium]|nr:ACP S-malonyltransferase [bacterium]
MIAFMFPGQGAQYVGMGVDLADAHPGARRVFEEASDAAGVDLLDLCRTGPEERLRQTELTQPAILTCSWAIASTLAAGGIHPALAAGLSLGEYTALVAGGALTFADAVRVVRERGRFMQDAANGRAVAMAAVLGLPAQTVVEICRAAPGFVEVSNFNAPGQTVIAGDTAAVDAAGDALRAAGARRVVRLDVSAPFHTSLMRPAADRLAPVLQSVALSHARIPVVANVSARPVRRPDEIRVALTEQVAHPVRWEQSLRTLRDLGATLYLEVGPGTTLAGLARRTLPDAAVMSVENQNTLEAVLTQLRASSAPATRVQHG